MRLFGFGRRLLSLRITQYEHTPTGDREDLGYLIFAHPHWMIQWHDRSRLYWWRVGGISWVIRVGRLHLQRLS